MTTSILRGVAPAPPVRLVDEAGVRYASAHAGLVIVALAAAAVRAPGDGSLVLLTVAALTGARQLAVGWRLGILLSAWAIWTGFFENTLGLLTFSDQDLARLAAMLGLGVLAASWDRLRS